MECDELKKILLSIKPDRHIISGRRGSEENVKIKIVIPLLQYLGYSAISNMDFELIGADIVIVDESYSPILIIETKAWEQQLSYYLNQCLEYTLKLKTPLILITSGQHTSLYSSLINPYNLEKTAPLIDFSFNDLIGNNSKNILEKLKELISKDNILNGSIELSREISKQLQPLSSLENAEKQFIIECQNFKSTIKSFKITEDDFIKISQKHSKEIFESLCFGKDEFNRIAHENKNFRIRYRSKEIGLEYLLPSKPRSKIIGLVGIYPEKAKIAFGLEGWEQLNITQQTLTKIRQFNRLLKNKNDVNNLANLLENAIKEIE